MNSNAAAWWLSSGGSTEGPFPTEHIIEWLRRGQIAPDTAACPVGGTEWKSLMEFAAFAGFAPPPAPAEANRSHRTPPPNVSVHAARARFGVLNAAIIGNSLALLFEILLITDTGEGPPALYLLMLAIAATAITTWAVFLYRLWALIPESIAETTPGKAVGFLFIPLFNCYWVFQSYLGVNRGLNRIADDHGFSGVRANNGLAAAAAVFFVVNWLFFLLVFTLPDLENLRGLYGYYQTEQAAYLYNQAVDQHVGFNVLSLLFSSIPGFVIWLLMVLNQRRVVEHLLANGAPVNPASGMLGP